MKISKILLLVDSRHPGQLKILRRAAALARIEGADLTVCEFVEWVVPKVPRYMTEGTVRVLNDTIRDNKTERLKELVTTSGVGDLDISVAVLVGKPHIEVARVVHEDRYDLVIKPVAGRRVMQYFSSVQEDRELIRNCPCPVWLIRAGEQETGNCILAALDMPPKGGSEIGLNDRIVKLSRLIALSESRPLHFVHAWQLRGEGHMRAQCNPATDLEVDRMLACEAAKRKTWLQNTVAMQLSDMWRSGTDKLAPGLHIPKGNPKKIIPDLADKLGAELIVMGNAARTGISGTLRRNTTETVLPRSDCSLLVVKQPQPSSSPVSQARHATMVGQLQT